MYIYSYIIKDPQISKQKNTLYRPCYIRFQNKVKSSAIQTVNKALDLFFMRCFKKNVLHVDVRVGILY